MKKLNPDYDINKVINSRFISHFKSETWGSEILIMEREGKAFARTYWYDDDKASIYFDMLSVNSKIRRHGIGTDLLKMHEEIGKELGATASYLGVKKDSWIHDWYKRVGYKYYKEHEEENVIWMRKRI